MADCWRRRVELVEPHDVDEACDEVQIIYIQRPAVAPDSDVVQVVTNVVAVVEEVRARHRAAVQLINTT